MALVAYDYDSSNSENDEEKEEDSGNVILNRKDENSENVILNKNQPNSVNSISKVNIIDAIALDTSNRNKIDSNDSIDNVGISSMFATLPKSHLDNKIVDEDKIEDFIPKVIKVKEKQKVKITIPSLSQFEETDDDLPKRAKIQPCAKGSSLLSLLPPVKGTILSNKSFVPNSVTQKSKNVIPVTTKSFVPHSVKKKVDLSKASTSKPTKATKPQKRSTSSDIESDDDIEVPETFDDEMWQKVCGRPKPKQVIQDGINEDLDVSQQLNIAPEPVEPYSGLDNEAFKELLGKNRKDQNINIIDIHEDDILPEKDLWMMKSITDPEQAPKPVVENPVDPTRKRKHHITYLAEQAKANEQELQNQWSASKFSRNQTRAKYGF